LRKLVHGTEELVAQEAQETHLSPKERVTPIVDVIRGECLEEGSKQRDPVSTHPCLIFHTPIHEEVAKPPAQSRESEVVICIPGGVIIACPGRLTG